MTDASFTAGDRVRFVTESLGTIDPAALGVKFTDHVVGTGDLGTVTVEPGPMPDGWLAVEPDDYPGEYVPVHPAMIERTEVAP